MLYISLFIPNALLSIHINCIHICMHIIILLLIQVHKFLNLIVIFFFITKKITIYTNL